MPQVLAEVNGKTFSKELDGIGNAKLWVNHGRRRPLLIVKSWPTCQYGYPHPHEHPPARTSFEIFHVTVRSHAKPIPWPTEVPSVGGKIV